MNSKRLLSLILAICLVFSAFAPAASAVEAGESSVLNATQTAEESTATEQSPFTNDNLVSAGKQTIQTHRDEGETDAVIADSDDEGQWVVTPAEGEPEVSLIESGLSATLEELKLAAEVYEANEVVTAFVVMEDAPLADSYSSISLVSASVEKPLIEKQDAVIAAIEKQVLGGKELNVKYQFTYLTNSFSIKTEFSNLEKIASVKGVKSVFIAPVYYPSEATSSPYTIPSGALTGVPSVWNDLGYTGAGMKIAVIDTGLDLDHPSFAADPVLTDDSLTMKDIDDVLEDLNAYAARSLISSDLLYRSAKVPYAFNYVDASLTADHSMDTAGDHGTHVAGIAAANKVEGVNVAGMAPDAQIIVMKVFGMNGGAYTDDIVAALEDAMTLGCDVANLSLGSSNGFTTTDPEFDMIYDRIASQDTLVAIAAGNEGTSGYGNMWGTDSNLTSYPENSTISYPSTYPNATSVASAENSIVKTAYFTAAGQKIYYMDSYEYLLGSSPYSLQDLAGVEMEYVIIPGLGSVEDFASVDVAGKVAIVMRGELSFSDKCYNAEMAGAAAVIIWNNNDTDDIFSFGMTTSTETYVPGIPVGLITLSDGNILDAAEEKTMVVASEFGDRPVANAGQMSSFTSWGTTSDLRLLPDITAIGGNVYSAYDGGGYGLMSGTSMATPQLAGIAALVMQHLKVEFPNVPDGTIRAIAEALLMSTADVVVDAATGLESSPRAQGSGLVDADGAINSKVYLTAGGKKPKAELGDNANGSYKFSFEIHNFGDTDVTYDLSASLLTEDALDSFGLAAYGIEFMAGYEKELSGDVTFNKDTVTVAAGAKADITVTVKLSADDKAWLEQHYPNGGYVEGFVYLTAESGEDLSLPYMGFYGDWTESEVFDTAYWYDNSFWGAAPATGLPEGNQYYTVVWTDLAGTDWVLGFNPYTGAMADENGNIIYDPANNVVSPNGDGVLDGIDEIYLSLMRNAKYLTFTYTVDGEVVHEETITNAGKTFYNSNYGQIVPWIYSWYGSNMYRFTDAQGKALPSGTDVVLTVEAEVDYADGGDHSIQIPITVDTEGPQLLAAVDMPQEDGTNYIGLVFAEDVAPADAFLMNPSGTQILAENPYIYAREDGLYEVYFPVDNMGTEFTVALCDYAANESYYTVTYTSNGDNAPEVDTSALYAYRVNDYDIYSDYMYGWVTLDKETGAITELTSDYAEYYSLIAAEYVNGTVFAVDAGYNLLKLQPGLWYRDELCNLGVNVLDMAFDKTTNTMYLLTRESSYSYLETLDLMTGERTRIGRFGYYNSNPYAMTFDDEGNLFAVRPGSANLYNVTWEGSTLSLTAVTDAEGADVVITLDDGTECAPSYYSQSMVYSAEDDCIYWAYLYSSYYGAQSALVTIDMETYETSGTMYETMKEFVGLIVMEDDADYELPYGGELVSISLDQSSINLGVGASAELTVSALPWDYEVTDATWTSSNENVVTVADGVVTGVAAGSAVVTVTVGECTAECTVSVVEPKGSVYAYNYYSGDGNYNTMIEIDLATGTYEALASSPVDFISGDYNGHDGYFYGFDASCQFYRMDLETYECVMLGTPGTKLPYDMAYDYSTGLMYAMYFDGTYGVTFVYAVDLSDGSLEDPGEPLTNYVADYGMAMACDMDGNIYMVGMYGDLYKGTFTEYGLEMMWVMDLLEDEEAYLGLLQSMCYDHSNDVLIWANADYSLIYWIDVNAETPYASSLGDPTGSGLLEFVGLFTVPAEIPELPYVEVESVTAENMLMLVGSEAAPAVGVMPLNATNRTAQLTSGDETIVKVTENGALEAVAVGTATVTATITTDTAEYTTEFQVKVIEGPDYVYGHVVSDLATGGASYWVRVHTEQTTSPDYLAACGYVLFAAEKVGDKVYAYGYDANDWSANWQLLVMDAETYAIEEMYAQDVSFPFVYDMTFDYATGTMYAVAGASEESTDLYAVDLETGNLILLMKLDSMFLSLAAADGVLYAVEESTSEYDPWSYSEVLMPAKLYAIDPINLTCDVVGDTGVYHNSLGAMTYDYDGGYLYWAALAQTNTGYASGLYVVDPETAESYSLGLIDQAGAQTVGLYIDCENYPELNDSVMNHVLLSSNKEILLVGETATLTPYVLPTTVEAEITWTSSNEDVATVDASGNVTALAQGNAVITATATAGDVTLTAECTVGVLNADASFLTYDLSVGGWALVNRNDASQVTNLTEGDEVPVNAIAAIGNTVYGYDAENNFFTIHNGSFERTVIGAVNEEELITAYLTENMGEDAATEEALAAYGFEVRDMGYDAANDRILVLGAVYSLEYGEMEYSNAIFAVNMEDGTLENLHTFYDKYNVKSMAVGNDGTVYFYCAYDDGVCALDLETGDVVTLVSTYTQSLYGSTEHILSMHYDALADMLYMTFTSNGKAYKMVTVDPDTGLLTDEGYIGESVYESWYYWTDAYAGLVFVELPRAELAGTNLTTEGNIGVNFYVELSEDVAADENAKLMFSVGNASKVVDLEDALQVNDTMYRFTYEVAAKEMADEITAQMYMTGGTVGKPMVYSVMDYYEAVKEYFDPVEEAALYELMEAMLNYGAYSQLHFGYNTDDLANANLDEAAKALPETVDASAYKGTVVGAEDGIVFYGSSLLLESQTTLRLFFKLTGDKTIDAYEITVDGEVMTPVERNGVYYVDVTNIAAKDLDEMYNISVGGLNVSYSVLSYVYTVLANSDSFTAELVDAVKALYVYSEKANAYFVSPE